MEFDTIIFEKKDGVARITLNRPEALNAFSPEMSDELKEVVKDIAADRDVRVVVITGAGDRAFMAGADLKKTILAWVDLAEKGGSVKDDLKRFFSPSMLEDLPQPVIAAVNGYAFGGGCEVAMACDIRIAADNAQFGQPEIKRGLMPGMGGTVRLTRLVGKSKAMEMMLIGDGIDAQEAYRIGLVNKVVPREKLDETVNEIAEKLKANGAAALRLCKASVNGALEMGVREALDNEADLFWQVCKTEDAKEGATSFLEKRKPVYKGR